MATSICSFAAQSLAFVALPFLFELGFGRSQVETGLLMTPWPVAVAVAAPIAGRLSDRFPSAILGSIGLAGLAAGMALLAELPSTRRSSTSPGRWRCAAPASASSRRPTIASCCLSAPRKRAGAAGGMLATARLTGMATGATLAALFFRVAPQGAEPIALWSAPASPSPPRWSA